jgi:Ca2+-binding RTX toxin-like protein
VSSIIPPLPSRPSAATLFAQQTVSDPTSIADGTTDYWTADFTGFVIHGSLSNAGLLWGSGATAMTAVELTDRGSFSNSGTVIAEAAAGYAVAIDVAPTSTGATISNSGELFAIASAGNACGIRVAQAAGSVENGGTIAAQAFGSPESRAIGILASEGGVPIVNGATGQILAEGDCPIGVWMRGSDADAGYAYELDNRGLIEAASTLPGLPSYGLYLAERTGQQMRVLNGGTIEASVAILAPSEDPDVPGGAISYTSETITNSLSGVIIGAIELRNGDDALVNRGQITGMVDMGPGNDRVDTTDGTLDGLAYLGLGDDFFLGSAAGDRATGDGGDDRLEGNGGNDLLLGGTGNDVVIGGSGNDGLYGEFGNDQLFLEAADDAFGGAGDDQFKLADYSFDLIDGGAGFDTLLLPGGERLLDLSAVASSGRLVNIEEIVLNGSKELAVSASDIAAITGSSSLRIDALATDKVDLVGAWLERDPQMIDGVTYRVFVGGGVTLLVDAAATIANVNAPLSGAAGLDPIASGAAAPQAGDAAGLYADQGLTTLFDPYEIDGTAVNVEAYETWDNVQGGAVFLSAYAADESTSVNNLGQVSSSGDGALTRVIDLYRGAVQNFGTIWADNVGAGGALAVRIASSGMVANDGDIISTAQSGDAIGVQTGDRRAAASAVNQASGYVNAVAVSGHATGIVATGAGATIQNDGTIEVAGGAGATGVELSAGGTVVNNGQISASDTGGASSGIGIAALGPGTVVNTGLISADVGIFIESGASDPFTIANSGTIDGSVLVDPENAPNVTIDNSGTIDGDVHLAGGNDVYDGSAGTLYGSVHAGAGADRLVGGPAADSFDGGIGNDRLTGGAGADRLTGGSGRDTFTDTAAGLNGDTITDFTAGDMIVITDAALAGFTVSRLGNTVNFTGGSLTLANGPAGHIVASAAANGGVQLTLIRAAHDDFNGDGRSDLLLRNDNGLLAEWTGQSNGCLYTHLTLPTTSRV